jgi:4-hydroxy-2-oxoheptanedioate aldolase
VRCCLFCAAIGQTADFGSGRTSVLKNRVIEAAKEGRPSFGVYVFSGSPKMIELLGFAGLDYVRIDMESTFSNPETVHRMIQTAHAVGITPFVRIPESIDGAIDDNLIYRVLGMGALGIVLPRGRSVEQIKAAVRAVKGAPLGDRHIGTGGFTGGYGREDYAEHLAWANEHVMLSVQVETKSGIDSIDEIVQIPGLDMVQSGRGDLSYEYGVPGQQYHPIVLEAENKMIEAGLKAGKYVSVQYYPIKDAGQIPTIRGLIDRGVHALNLGIDLDVIDVYRRLLRDLTA